MMINFLFGVLRQTWEILEEASVFLLFGFLLAGMLGILVPGRLLTRLVGTGKIKSVLWGSVVGAPIPIVLLRRPANSARAAQAGSDAGRHRRVPRRDAGNRGRQHQPDLRADRPGHDLVPPHRRGGNGDCRGARHESVRRPALESDRAAAGGRQDPGRSATSDVSTQTTPEDMITRTGTITTTTMTRGRIRCRSVAPAGQSLIRQGTSSVTASSSCSTT